jgi:putative inorganic carbon (HCO3(-)) transporter
MKVDHGVAPVNAGPESRFLHQLRRGAAFLAGYEIWIVIPLVVGGLLTTRLMPVAVGVAGSFWGIRWVGTGRLSIRTPADWAIGLLVVMIPVTLWATALPDQTMPQVFRLLNGIALYYVIVNGSNSMARVRLSVYGFVLAGLGLAIFAPISVNWSTSGKLPFIPPSIYGRFTLFVADTVHPNVMAGFLVVLVPLALAISLFDWKWLSSVHRIWIGLASLFPAGILILTKSRGAWVAFAMVLVLMAILRWRRGWIGLVALLIGAGIAIYLLGITPILEALSTTDTISGIDGRLEIWSRAIYMIQDFPFTGVGMGSFTQVADTLYPFFLAAPGTIMHAHNLFLQVAVDLGLPGLIAWLGTFSVVVVAAWQLYQRGRVGHNYWLAGLGAGLLGSQLALVVHGIVDAVTWGQVRPAPLIWALWGLTFASWHVYVSPSATNE